MNRSLTHGEREGEGRRGSDIKMDEGRRGSNKKMYEGRRGSDIKMDEGRRGSNIKMDVGGRSGRMSKMRNGMITRGEYQVPIMNCSLDG